MRYLSTHFCVTLCHSFCVKVILGLDRNAGSSVFLGSRLVIEDMFWNESVGVHLLRCADHSQRGWAPQQLSTMAVPIAENWGGAEICGVDIRRNAGLGAAQRNVKRTDQIGVDISSFQCAGYVVCTELLHVHKLLITVGKCWIIFSESVSLGTDSFVQFGYRLCEPHCGHCGMGACCWREGPGGRMSKCSTHGCGRAGLGCWFSSGIIPQGCEIILL